MYNTLGNREIGSMKSLGVSFRKKTNDIIYSRKLLPMTEDKVSVKSSLWLGNTSRGNGSRRSNQLKSKGNMLYKSKCSWEPKCLHIAETKEKWQE